MPPFKNIYRFKPTYRYLLQLNNKLVIIVTLVLLDIVVEVHNEIKSG